MEKNQRKIHLSGPLGKLLETGEIREVTTKKNIEKNNILETSKNFDYVFKTKSGIEFQTDELIYVNPKECIPWKYANRQKNEYANIEELITSIKKNGQLQPALIRACAEKDNNIKYEVIFGCRRHFACLRLGIPFLVILKKISDIKEAIVAQDAENKYRKNISYYSNALLYERLLHDKIFSSEKELATKLNISTSNLNEIMIFTKIPKEVIKLIPNIYSLSKNFATSIVELSKKSDDHYKTLLDLSPNIGESISSPNILKSKIEQIVNSNKNQITKTATKQYYSSIEEKRLFTFKYDHRGAASIVFNKELSTHISRLEHICDVVKNLLEKDKI